MTEPTLPVSQPTTVIKFWDGQKFRFCPKCQRLAFDFADAYATYVTAERDRELQQAREALERERKRVVIGGDIFETSRNELILHQSTELDYLQRADSAEKSLSEAREELARLKDALTTIATGAGAATGWFNVRNIARSALAVPEKPDHHE